ncbi:MbcA/ParS/Xre antitoxin family protein [Chitinibacter sp. SCUT-21]|uniref:antitoxin Xre/MbcA/ParS toxin-binding domain-containing protein n=1 Tax=Chitinibacter sp. SCUT-21 TaxID=2970891 RepID=UPI0035A6DED2
MQRISNFLILLEKALAEQPDLYADLKAVMQFEPTSLLAWLPLLDLAEQKFGDLETVVQWLTCPHAELNGQAPAILVGSQDGIERAKTLLAMYEAPPWRS